MPTVHNELFKVRHYECDAYGHMNNAVYLRYMQEAGIEAAAAIGQDHEELECVVNRCYSLFDCEIKHMPPGFAVCSQEVNVITGDINSAYVLGTPETDNSPGNIGKLED